MTFDYSIAGTFLCGSISVGGSCTSNADGSILLSDGTSTLQIAFTPASGTAAATNVATPLALGTISTTYGGTGAFLFPWAGIPNANYSFSTLLAIVGGGRLYGAVSNGGPAATLLCCGGEQPNAILVRWARSHIRVTRASRSTTSHR